MNQADAMLRQVQYILDNNLLSMSRKNNHSSKKYITKKWLKDQYLDRIYVMQNFLGKKEDRYWDVWQKKFHVENYGYLDSQSVCALQNMKLDDADVRVQSMLEEFC